MRISLALVLLSVAACGGSRGHTGFTPGDAATPTDSAGHDGAALDGGTHDAGRVDLGPRVDMGPPPGGCLPHGCPTGQVCADGYCSPAPDASFLCGTNPFSSDDMCGMEGVCVGYVEVDGTVVSDRHCYQYGPCPADGRCPISSHGATCNIVGGSQLIGNKGAICLAGFCRSIADCPTTFRCIVAMAGGGGIGYCSDGAAGSLCNGNDDCDSAFCMQIAAGSRGTCM